MKKHRVREFFAELGPGLVTGAADDDPSGVATYSVAGARLGYAPLWLTLVTFPLMSAVQLMCARIGMVTGLGLAAVIRRYYPRWVLWGACALLTAANLLNIGADLGGMAEATELITSVPSLVWVPVYGLLLLSLLFWTTYRQIARVFKWLTLVLFAYMVTPFLSHPDWGAVLRATFLPEWRWSNDYVMVVVAVLGTNISPYLFFWQSAQEVEEERAKGRRTEKSRRGATDEELRSCRNDTIAGMFYCNVVMYFIILTTAATLHAHGRHEIQTAKDAAEALRPLAGHAAYLLFTVAMIGTGVLAVPVLAGSSAYAIAEAMHWKDSLDKKPAVEPKFYSVVGAAMMLGAALDFAGFPAVKMLFWSAMLNGVLAPPLLLLVVLVSGSSRIMGKRVNPPALRWLGWFTVGLMTAAAVAAFVCG